MGGLSNLFTGDDERKHEAHGKKAQKDQGGNPKFKIHGNDSRFKIESDYVTAWNATRVPYCGGNHNRPNPKTLHL